MSAGSAGRGPADPSAKNIWCDAKDHARPRKYLEQNIFSKRGVQVERENRGRYDRSKLRYPSDVSDEEWALVAPLIPAAKRGGNKRRVNLREVVNGLMYILSTGCQWATIPKDLPPRSTLHDYFDRWDYDGTLGRIHHALYVACRELAGRDASPSAAIIDSQSVKSAEKGGAALTRRAMTAARRSGARSVMSW